MASWVSPSQNKKDLDLQDNINIRLIASQIEFQKYFGFDIALFYSVLLSSHGVPHRTADVVIRGQPTFICEMLAK
jgi:hypothetical protein